MNKAPQRSGRVRRLSLLAAAGFTVAGCYRWEAVPPAAAPARLGYVEVRHADGSALRLARARLSADSLVGRRAGLTTTTRVAVPRDSLAALRRRRFDGRRSALAAAATAVLAALAFSVAAPFTPH